MLTKPNSSFAHRAYQSIKDYKLDGHHDKGY